jgi:hypothetical protein
MHAVGMTTLLPLLAAAAMIGVAFGFFSAVTLRKKSRRTRTVFAFGFLCGAAAAAIYDIRRRGIPALVTTYRRHALRSFRRGHLSLRDAVLVPFAGK